MSTAKSPVLMDATEMMKGMNPEDLKSLLKSKIADTMKQDVSPAVKKRINALKNTQVKLLEAEAKFYDELHELEIKYAAVYEPFFEIRRKIVTGEVEPTEAEAKWALDEEEETTEKAIENGDKVEKGVENFWLETLQSFPITTEIIQEYDEPILGYLQDIQVKLFDKKPYGYSLEFHFGENPFFTNKVLTKTYELKTEVDPKDPFAYDGPNLEKATGCKINWNAEQNVCLKMVKKKLKPKNKKLPPKVVTKEEKQDSFFNFFETPKVTPKAEGDDKTVAKKSESEVDDEDEDHEEHDQELYLMADFEIGQYLKEKIIPKAILYYTGECVDDEFDEDDYEDEDEDDEEGDEDEDEDEDDDDEEEDEDDDEPKKAKKAIKGKKGKNGEPTPSECKQN